MEIKEPTDDECTAQTKVAHKKEGKMSNKEQMIEILKQHDMELEIDGCGCCGSPWVTFKYKGNVIIKEKDFCLDLEDFSKNKS